MARKDVDLIIRAKDEASSAVKAITKALNTFTDAQKDTEAESKKTGSSLQTLGKAFSDLKKSASGLNVGTKLAQDFDKAGASVKELRGELKSSIGALASVEQRLKRSADQSARYAESVAKATEAQKQQAIALRAAKKSQTEQTIQLEKAARAQAKLEKRAEKLPELIDRQARVANNAAVAFGKLATKMAQTEEPSASLAEKFANSETRAKSTAAALNKLDIELGEIGGHLKTAAVNVSDFADKTGKAERNVSRQTVILAQMGTGLARLKDVSRAAAQQQSALSTEFRKTERSLRGNTATLVRAQKEYRQLATNTKQAADAQSEFAADARSGLTSALTAQRRVMLQSKKSYVDLSTEATRLGAAISRVNEPTNEMVRDFKQAKAAALEAKNALLQNRIAVTEMNSAFRNAGDSLQKLNGVQARFVASQEKLSTELNEGVIAANKERAAIDKLYGSHIKAGQGANRQASATERLADAQSRATAATRRVTVAGLGFNSGNRTSLGLLQRVRGELLAMVAAYGGLYGVVRILKGSVEATQALAAAQARLTVAFPEGGQEKIGKEMDFVRRTANRLGIDIKVLSTEYSKFAVSTRNTAIEGENTRKIFVSVAEAAVVNKSSIEEMAGVFKALVQIVSKGKVQMEELRGQLGDRLPGALQLMADGMGVTVAELDKLIERGEVGAEALVGFADALDERFGPGLAAALSSNAVAAGRLQNAATQALASFGRGGFIDSLTDAFDRLRVLLSSTGFEEFSQTASAAIGGLVSALVFLVENFKLVATVVGGLFVARLSSMAAAALASGASFGKLGTVLRVVAQNGLFATKSIKAMTAAVKGLEASTIIGLAFIAVLTAFEYGMAAVNAESIRAKAAIEPLAGIIDQVRDAADKAGTDVTKFNEEMDKINPGALAETQAAFKALQSEIRRTSQELLKMTSTNLTLTDWFFEGGTGDLLFGRLRDVTKEIQVETNRLSQELVDGKINSQQYREALQDVSDSVGDADEATKDYVLDLIRASKELGGLVDDSNDAALAIDALSGNTEVAAAALAELGIASSDAVGTKATQAMTAYEKAMQTLKDTTKSTTAQTKELAEAAKIEGAYQEAIASAREFGRISGENVGVINKLIQAADDVRIEALTELAHLQLDKVAPIVANGTALEAAMNLIRSKEGFISKPAFDVNAFRAGYGSDTYVNELGKVIKVTKDHYVSLAEAEADLKRRTKGYLDTIQKQIGTERFGQLTTRQKAALASNSHNYGSLSTAIVAALRTGNNDAVRAALISQSKQLIPKLDAGKAPGQGVNAKRRLQEAATFTGTEVNKQNVQDLKDYQTVQKTIEEERVAAAEKAADDAAKRVADQLAYHEDLKAEIVDKQFLASIENLSTKEQQVQIALHKAELEAKKLGTQLSAEERNQIIASTEALYAKRQAEEDIAATKKAAVDAEAEVNRQLSIQKDLQEQLKIAKEIGDGDAVTSLEVSLANINAGLVGAIEKAKAMWAAIGGSAADVAIAKLDTMSAKIKQADLDLQDSIINWEKLGSLLADGLTNAFLKFAKAVAEGENAQDAAKQAFLEFASSFLLEIAKMIIKQTILNAISAISKAFGAGHTGGLVGGSRIGSGNSNRSVNPAAFAGAVRYHSGGVVGLRPNEVPAILERGEEVLTRDDPRHSLNGEKAQSRGQAASPNIKIVNAFNGSDMLDNALSSAEGEEVLMNYISNNAGKVKAALG